MYIDKDKYESILNTIYPGLTLLYRDFNLENIDEKYEVDMIIRERGFVDTSIKGGGMVTSHRYAILSNRYEDLSELEHGTNWGLNVINRDAHFKILDILKLDDKTQITLLHLPEENWELFNDLRTSVDKDIVEYTRKCFKELLNSNPVPELNTKEWLGRCSFPIGIDDEGNLFDLY